MSIEAMKQAFDLARGWQKTCLDGGFGSAELGRATMMMELLRQAIEQAEKQEPVMWMDAKDFAMLYSDGTIDCNTKPHQENPDDVPLYTTPQQRELVELTDEEILQCYSAITKQAWDYIGFARAIEAKLKEKNHVS